MTPWQVYDIALDHLVLGAVSLPAGQAWLEQQLGVKLQPGGQHTGWGTHNKLLHLGGGVYLELIAADPDQPEPTLIDAHGKKRRRERPFGLDRPATRRALAIRPRLLHYVMRTRQLSAAVAALDYDCGVVRAMSRGSLSWQISIGEHGMPRLFRERDSAVAERVGVLATLIDWGASPHPCSTLPQQGVTFQSLTIAAPAPRLIRLGGVTRDPRMILRQAAAPALGLELHSPLGWALLD